MMQADKNGNFETSTVIDPTGGNTHIELEINHRVSSIPIQKSSAWAIAEVLAWDRPLSKDEMTTTMNYFTQLLRDGTPYRDTLTPRDAYKDQPTAAEYCSSDGVYPKAFNYTFLFNGCCKGKENLDWSNSEYVNPNPKPKPKPNPKERTWIGLIQNTQLGLRGK